MEPKTDTPGRAIVENFSNRFPPLKFQENIKRPSGVFESNSPIGFFLLEFPDLQ